MFRKKVKFIPQMELHECGVASLAMILTFHGCHICLPELRQACGTSRDSANVPAIVAAARKYDLAATRIECDLHQLRDYPLPAIAQWDFNHFLVIERVAKNGIIIVDPASGRRSMHFEEARGHFTGLALHFLPKAQFKKRKPSYSSCAKYGILFKEIIPNLLQIIMASMSLQIIGLLFPAANQILLDRVILPVQNRWLLGMGFGLGGAVLFRALFSLVRSYVIQGVQNNLDVVLMTRFIDQLFHLPMGFFVHREPGDLIQRAYSNTAIRNMLGSHSISAVFDGVLLLGYAALMIAYNSRLGAVVLLFSVLRLIVVLLFKEKNQQLMAAELASGGREGGALVEALTGLETTKASRAGSRMVQRWVNRMTLRINNSLERRKLSIAMNQAVVLVQGFTTATVFGLGGHEVMENRMSIGVFAAFLMLQNLFFEPLETLFRSLSELQFLGMHLQRLDDILETKREISGTLNPGRLRGAVSFERVSFRYDSGVPYVVKDISFSIRPGEKVAFIGPSGAGKSTVANLLLGIHTPTSGRIKIDGRDIRELDIQMVRNQIGAVQQETFLFDDTVRANLSLYDASVTLEDMQEAAEIACIDHVIENLPEGYATSIGENGGRFSGGERQRLTLARALVHAPAILLLDEATSSLDLDTEAKLHANLARLGCTRIIIAHRMATVKDADRIFLFDKGRIVRCGSYDDLFASTEVPYMAGTSIMTLEKEVAARV